MDATINNAVFSMHFVGVAGYRFVGVAAYCFNVHFKTETSTSSHMISVFVIECVEHVS